MVWKAVKRQRYAIAMVSTFAKLRGRPQVFAPTAAQTRHVRACESDTAPMATQCATAQSRKCTLGPHAVRLLAAICLGRETARVPHYAPLHRTLGHSHP